MGLGGWSPSGLVQWSMELINVGTGMPWFWTIVAGTVVWRAICVPFAVVALRSSARMQPHQAAIEKNRLDVMDAYKSKNQLQLLRAQAATTEFNKKHGINPLGGLAGLIQLPVTLGTFFGVREMGLLPVEQLKQSGLALIPDLTVPDPTFLMPALLCALVNVQISVAAKDMTLESRPGMGHLMNFLRVFSVLGFYIMTDFNGVSILLSYLYTLLILFVGSHGLSTHHIHVHFPANNCSAAPFRTSRPWYSHCSPPQTGKTPLSLGERNLCTQGTERFYRGG